MRVNKLSEVTPNKGVGAGLIDAKTTAAQHDAALNAMVDRFLCWQLPRDFGPDCYVRFDREKAEKNNIWPIGTNLLTAEQAKAMFKECVPPLCFGLDDCSSQALSTCKFANKCGDAIR